MKTKEKIKGAYISTLIFTNGVCPFCRENLAKRKKGKLMLKTNKALKHLKENHPKKELKKKIFFWGLVEKS